MLPKSQVIQEKFFSGTKAGADPDEQMPKVYKHQGIIAKRAAHRRASKSLIREFSVDVRRSEAVTLRQPVMPVFDSFAG